MLISWDAPFFPGVRGRQEHAAEGVPNLHAAHRGRGRHTPGLARFGSPAATTRPAGPLRAAGKPWSPNLEAVGGGGRGFAVPTRHPGRGKAAWGWGGGVQVSSSGTSRIRLLGTTMRHRELLRPLPLIKQMHRVQEPKHALQPEYRGTPTVVIATVPMYPLRGGFAGTYPARSGSAESPSWGHVGGLERVRLEPDFSLSPPV